MKKMIESFHQLHPIVQALMATGFTYLMTALGAAGVFLARDMSRKTLDGMLGFNEANKEENYGEEILAFDRSSPNGVFRYSQGGGTL